ncbi:hypothetical protein M427DRAFT_295741 [Gonapodya prolifera JEL478]|uniref:Uncharacterized protein n=1 Tax=Gonapodya prolifera (strain JEL478) TaxID=1344416 RepID=A0A139AIM5_GONPJ|nr:hypothetical protein M427DRAFT_295741 [Gonapodya prolifera JEL478]|eukprot:KXS16283.1 hypothetical protein M427DRAFT_295741 [Gonapodya prolifera JEL478]
MLMIHSAKDFRLPLTDGLGTFTALQRRGTRASCCTSPMRTTGCSSPPTVSSGTRRCSLGSKSIARSRGVGGRNQNAR